LCGLARFQCAAKRNCGSNYVEVGNAANLIAEFDIVACSCCAEKYGIDADAISPKYVREGDC
jgi:hypothetical protein